MKKTILLTAFIALLFLISCSKTQTDSTDITSSKTSSTSSTIDEILTDKVSFEKAYYDDYESEEYIILDDDSESYLIMEPGIYVLSGTITQTIVVDVGDEDVRLVLDNVNIETSENSAILILSGDDIIISAPEGTENTLTDGSVYTAEYSDYNGTIYSECDLAFNGTGSITINARYNNAIITKDDLLIVDVTLDITSIDDGIIGRDSLLVRNSTITIEADGDGLKATNDEVEEKGFIYIESGLINLTTEDDGIDGVTDIIIYGSTLNIDSHSKGIKSDQNIYIAGGVINIDSTDDCINANIYVEISGGALSLDTLDDAISSDEEMIINDGEININSCYEGIESPSITINGGTIKIVSSDDGINVASATQTAFVPQTSSSLLLTISGGDIEIMSDGDGVDVNGSIIMTGGTLYSSGPMDDDSAIDFDGTFTLTGGTVCGMGSSQMTQAPSTSSTQASIMISLSRSISAGVDIILYDDTDNILFQTETEKTAENIIISLSDLTIGDSYHVAIGSQYDISFTISSVVTYLNESGVTSGGTVFPTNPTRPPR
ncbi:MAG TPA: carbohydrate-binding domain-containing protein [Bacillota bacterium]|nr:carbohydrate-binding domain-containing protein [Bacillota bacterium]HPJ23269.1 carbohydrate-binding domain-containing protein [Bacillota bacterium]